MPVAEVSGAKIIVRMTDTDRLGSEAKRFMNSRTSRHELHQLLQEAWAMEERGVILR